MAGSSSFAKPSLIFTLFCISGIAALLLPEIASAEPSRIFKPKDIKRSYGQKSPFVAYWNVPSYDCAHKFDIDFHLDKYGITANTGQNFTGDNIVLFYDNELGYYPFYSEKTSEPVNGGLPQMVNLSIHLEKATEDILKIIPDPNFNGVPIIDWESWRPQWEQNFDTRLIYRKKSIELVYNKHPEWTNETVKLVALVEFEQAAENMMESTLRLAKDLRPNARWGFYHYPYCYNKKKPGSCTQTAILTNNNITWLFDSTTALYPSIYMHGSQVKKAEFVQGVISEALRIRNISRNHFIDIYPYARYQYSYSELFLTKNDLNVTVLQAAEMGLSGIVFWGSKNDTHTAESCLQVQSYLNSTLGPFVKEIIDATTICSADICSGNGRCVGKVLECADLLLRRKESVNWSGTSEQWKHTVTPCSCQCYKGWKGLACDQSSEY